MIPPLNLLKCLIPDYCTHLGSGIVRAVGSQVKDVQVGDHVILSYNFCGGCRSCAAKQTYQCLTAQKQNFGGARPDGSQTIVVSTATAELVSTCFFGQSSFCNPAVVQEASCVKIDPDLPLSVVCALGCGFQTGAGSVYNVIKPLERKARHVAIFGIGGVGCAAIMAARHLMSTSGASFDIIAVDFNDSRLELAKELGASRVINPREKPTREAVLEITSGEGLDAAVDCTGSLDVINEMIGLIAVGGIAVTVGGPPPGSKASVDVFDMLIKCKTYSGCHQGNAYSKEVSSKVRRTKSSLTVNASVHSMVSQAVRRKAVPAGNDAENLCC